MVIRSLVAALMVAQVVQGVSNIDAPSKTIAQSTREYVTGRSQDIFAKGLPITYAFAVEAENKDKALVSKEIAWATAGALIYSAAVGLASHNYNKQFNGSLLSRLGQQGHALHHGRDILAEYVGTLLAARLVRHGYNFWMGPARRNVKRPFSVFGIQPARAS